MHTRATIYTVTKHARSHFHIYTNTQIHLDEYHMFKFVNASVFMQLRLMEDVYLIFIWFVLTLSLASVA